MAPRLSGQTSIFWCCFPSKSLLGIESRKKLAKICNFDPKASEPGLNIDISNVAYSLAVQRKLCAIHNPPQSLPSVSILVPFCCVSSCSRFFYLSCYWLFVATGFKAILYTGKSGLRYHGGWIFKKNAKNLFFAVQIEKTEKNNLQKEWRKKLFYFLQ